MIRDLIRLAAAGGLLSVLLLASCTGSEDLGLHRDGGAPTGSGEAGSGSGEAGSGSGEAGSGAAGSNATGAAGSTSSGAAGKAGNTGSGAGAGAGTTGAAGSTTGAAGSTSGAAGSTSGAAGKGSAGTSGAAGTTGAAGSTSTGAAGAGSMVDPGIGCGPIKVYTYSGGIENLLIQNCGGCHYAAPGVNVQGGFSFSYANVTGVTNGHPSCVGLDASKKRVVAGKPDNSLLWIKAYLDSPPSGCGGHMPFTGSRLTMANLCYIRAWIVAGAPP